MEESIRKAREKAEFFLSNTIEEISKEVKRGNKDIFSRPVWDSFPLRFEAHSYLSNKNKIPKKTYSDELRNIWSQWIKQLRKETSEIQETNIFYYYESIWGEFENSISMLRAKEILKIPGFQDYVDHAIEELKSFLINPLINFDDFDIYENYWLILRSNTNQSKNEYYIQNLAYILQEKLKKHSLQETVEDAGDVFWLVDVIAGWINASLFFIIQGYESNYISYGKEIIEKLIDYQEENGSIFNDLFASCSFLIAVCLSEIDTLKNVQEKILRWIASRQNSDGSWTLWTRRAMSDRLSENQNLDKDVRVLSTVLVLEAIDLVFNDEPLPPWIPTEIAISSLPKKHSRIQDITPLQTPTGCTWSDVSICFTSTRNAELRAGDFKDKLDYGKMGFKNKTTKRPDISWGILLSLAKHGREITWETCGLPLKTNSRLKPHIKDIRARLKYLFQIDDDPFEDYNKVKAYRTKFAIYLKDGFDHTEPE